MVERSEAVTEITRNYLHGHMRLASASSAKGKVSGVRGLVCWDPNAVRAFPAGFCRATGRVQGCSPSAVHLPPNPARRSAEQRRHGRDPPPRTESHSAELPCEGSGGIVAG